MAIAVDATNLGRQFCHTGYQCCISRLCRAGRRENLKSFLLLNKDKASENGACIANELFFNSPCLIEKLSKNEAFK